MFDFSRTSPVQRWVVPAFFAVVLVMGLLLFRDYGTFYDEDIDHRTGMTALKYVGELLAPGWVAADPEFANYPVRLTEYGDRDYGTAFQLPVCLLERLLGFNDPRHKYLLRHLCTFLVCWGGLLALYQLAARRFQDWRLGLLAALFLLLSPRLFADSFYNSKDAVFMAIFTIGANAVARLLLVPTTRRARWAALACALAIDVRIMGVLLPAAALGLLVWRGVRGDVPWRQVRQVGLVYFFGLIVLIVLLWPYLWSNPGKNFITAFRNMSAFRWDDVVLYQGRVIHGTKLPWHYPLVWIGITTPLLYLATGLLGTALVLRQLVRHHWRLWADEGQMQDILFLGLFLGPLLAVIALHSVLYDGWRQLYFIYPAFLLLAVRGWVALAGWRLRWPVWARTWQTLTAACLLYIAGQLVNMHPLQNVYFNVLAGPDVPHRFEMDYWGLGYPQGLRYILAHDSRPLIKVSARLFTGLQPNIQMLPREQRTRLLFVEKPAEADYFLTNYRWHPQAYEYQNRIFDLYTDGRLIHSVFKLR